ncbi:MAG: hypothetical protein H8Z69_00995 [Nanohaloarchaea archaeon]|nr:hypothetical protein [Candidatus Nanohaloarchaea archaeon]
MDPKKLVLALALVLFTISVAAQSSNWNVEKVGAPENVLQVTNNTSTIKLVKLTDSEGDPVTGQRLERDDADLYYRYGPFNERNNTEYLVEGYYMAEFKANASKTTKVQYNLYDDSSDGFETAVNQSFTVGDMELEKLTGPTSIMKADEEYTYEIRTINRQNGDVLSNSDVNVWFTNGTWTSEKYDLNNYDNDPEDQYWYNSKVKTPPGENRTYVMHIEGSTTSGSSVGSRSWEVDTYPTLEGKVNTLHADQGCNNMSFFTECSGETLIETEYEVTGAEAENVNLSIRKWHPNSSQWIEHDTTRMENLQEQKYEAEMNIPVIDTSNYSKKLQLFYNATNDRRQDVIKRNITYHSFEVNDLSSAKTPPGDYNVRMSVTRVFSTEQLNRSDIDADITIKTPEGENYTSFTLGDMEYVSGTGTYRNSINIPITEEAGIYSKRINVTDQFGDSKLLKAPQTNFNVTNASKTFETTDSIEMDIQRQNNYSYEMEIENTESVSRQISFDYTDGIEDVAQVNYGNEVNINGDETKDVPILFNISDVQSYDGEITLSDTSSDYSKNVEVMLDTPECDYKQSQICLETEGVDVDVSRTINVNRDFEIHYLGPSDSTKTYTPVVSGNISDFVTVEPETVTFDEDKSNAEGTLNYDFGSTGYFSGTFEVGEVSLDIDSNIEDTVTRENEDDENSNVNTGDLSFSVPNSVTITSETQSVMISNTGSTEIESLSFTGTPFSVETGQGSIPEGGSKSFDLTFSEVSSGTITVTGRNGDQQEEHTISVSAENPEEENIQDLRDRLTQLDQRINEPELQSQIDDVSSQINRLESQYTEQRYQSIVTSLNNIERQANSNTGGTQNPSNPTGPSEPNSGGGGFLPILIGVLVMLLIGFVGYTSVIPEQGDPGYSVLGK